MDMPADYRESAADPLYRIIYCSVMNFDGEALPFTNEIQGILNWSRDYNPRQGITGALTAGRSRFAQVIEGPKSAVKSLFASIACDTRHRRLLLLSSSPIATRDFPDWSMAFVSREDREAIPLSSRQEGSDLADSSVTAVGVLRMLLHVVGERPSVRSGVVHE